jgi:hypothetical protein
MFGMIALLWRKAFWAKWDLPAWVTLGLGGLAVIGMVVAYVGERRSRRRP